MRLGFTPFRVQIAEPPQLTSCMPGVVDSGIPDLRLAENGLPGSPVLGAFNWSNVACGEYQIKVCP